MVSQESLIDQAWGDEPPAEPPAEATGALGELRAGAEEGFMEAEMAAGAHAAQGSRSRSLSSAPRPRT